MPNVSINSSTVATPMRPTVDGADSKKINKQVNKRKRSSAQESAANELTPQSKQQKLLTDQQQQQALLTAKEMETEALIATQSILDDDDDTTDFFVESSSSHSSLLDIPVVENEISIQTIIETSTEKSEPASSVLEGFGELPKSQLNTSSLSPTVSLSSTSFVTIPKITVATTKKQHATTIKLNTKVPNVGNILQGATAKQTNLPSVFFKSIKHPVTAAAVTSTTLSSMANFIIKSNVATTTIASPSNLAITKTIQSNTLQQQLAISNAILLQHQQQKQQQQQQQQQGVVQPQFFISTKSNQGKNAVVSLQQIVNKKQPSPKSPNNPQGKPAVPLLNNVKHNLLSGKPLQTSSIGLTLGNLTSASLQNINQLISAKKNQAIINKQSKTRESVPAANLSPVNSSSVNKPLHLPSKQNITVASSKTKDSVRTLTSATPAQHSNMPLTNQKNQQNAKISLSSMKQSTVPKFVGANKSQLVSQPQVSGLKFVTAKTVAAQQTPMQTLSLNQLVAAARANLQTATVRSATGTPVAHIGATKIRPTNATNMTTTTTTTLQALLQVVQNSTQGGGVAPNAQLVIRPQQLATGGELQKVVRLPRATVVAKSAVSPSNTVSGVALQRQKSTGHSQSPVAATPIRAAHNVTAPLKILLPRTTFSGGTTTVRMSPNTVGLPSNRSPANIVFSSPNLVLSGQNGKISFSQKGQQSQEKK